MVLFPIGERWLTISVTAAVGGAMLTFTALPLLALFSMFWVYRMRIAKSLAMAKTRIQSRVIARQLDLGLITQNLFIRFDWLEPSLLRAVELGSLIVLFALTGNLNGEAGVAGFVILFSIAFNHYDNLYRSMQGEQKPTWLGVLGLGVIGRLSLVISWTLLGLNLAVFATYFLVLFLFVSSFQWVWSHRKSAKS
jgi:hypothetical protein